MPTPCVTGFNWRLALLITCLLLLAGCRDDFSSSSNQCVDKFGPAISVDETLPSFRIGAGSDISGNLQHTLMHTFFQAIYPDSHDTSSEAVRARYLAEQAGILSKPFLGFDDQFPDDFPGYASTRNMPDLMEALITSGGIETFNNARNAMRRCVEQDRGGSYLNNQVRLREKPPENGNGEPLGEPQEWRLQVSYNNNRQPLGNIAPNISRFITLTDAAVTFQTLYDPKSFDPTGYNPPRETRVFFNRSLGDLMDDTDGDGGDASDNGDNGVDGSNGGDSCENGDNGDSCHIEEGEPQMSFLVTRPDGLNQHLDQDVFLWTGRGEPYTLNGPDGEDMTIACMIFRADYGAGTVEVWTQRQSCGVLVDIPNLEPLENFTFGMNSTTSR
ncbi:MAG: hypothetical protein EA349_01830 [Halomonadaceae bacterium]|nr:MAG: hypothetical protein EA349_01830 [Halomonadaceae bacterium]